MKAMLKILTMALVLTMCLGVTANASEGEIDWVKGYVTATGYGFAKSGIKAKDAINSKKAAKVDALAQLLGVIKGVKIDSRTLVEDAMLKKEVISARIKGLIRGARVTESDTKWMDDGSVMSSVTMRVCISKRGEDCSKAPGTSTLTSTLAANVTPDPVTIPKTDFLNDAIKVEPIPVKKIDETVKAGPVAVDNSNFDPAQPVTGLVFSLRGFAFKRVMYPVVAIEEPKGDFQSVYSAKIVNPEVVRTAGLAWYTDTLTQARSITELGGNVLTVAAIAVGENDMIMISADDAAIIRDSVRRGNTYLADGKVAISAE